MNEENKYGTITIAKGTALQRDLKIVNIVQAQFKDHRLVSVAEIEDRSFLVSVENPDSTGRSNQKMWVSKESLIAVFGTLTIYSDCKEWNLTEEYKKSCIVNGIAYHVSDNLKKFGKDEKEMVNPVGPEEKQSSSSESEDIRESGRSEEEKHNTESTL